MAPVVCPEDDGDRQDFDPTQDLLRLARGGDQRAFSRLYHRYNVPLMRWAHGRLCPSARGQDDTADVVHLSFVKAFSSLGSFEHRYQGSFLGYLHRILRNVVASKNRRWMAKMPNVALVTDLPSSAPTPIQEVIDRERLELYDRGVAMLSEKDQELIHMREMGLTHAEIAEEAGFSTANAARMAVARGIERLTRVIQELSRDQERP